MKNQKVDFYVGLDPDLEWLGSLIYEGTIWNIPVEILIQVNKMYYEEMIFEFLTLTNGIIADKGHHWPHDWADSRLTDYSVIFDNNREKVVLYMEGINMLLDPIKIMQGYPTPESVIAYGTPNFPIMKEDQIKNTEELLKEYGYNLTGPV